MWDEDYLFTFCPETQQEQIQFHCILGMFDKVQQFITSPEEIEKVKNSGISAIPDGAYSLCQLCSLLSKKTMLKCSAYRYNIRWKYKTLWGWYADHCKKCINSTEQCLNGFLIHTERKEEGLKFSIAHINRLKSFHGITINNTRQAS